MHNKAIFALVFIFSTLATISTALSNHKHSLGEAIFKDNCNRCHAMPQENRNSIGPNLHGVVGRRAGSAEGYEYSKALKSSNITWAEQRLNSFLTNPRNYIGGSTPPLHDAIKMNFVGISDPAERQAVIEYLKSH